LVPVLLQDAWRTGPRLLLTTARDLVMTDLRPKLPRIQAQTLVVWGRHDGILLPSRADEICALIPHSRLFVLPNAGHNPMWEQPAEFNTKVLEFLSSPE
ncbi:MAG: alpha/beta hydrolase, partial [Verrucomicrobiaceae bacterium]